MDKAGHSRPRSAGRLGCAMATPQPIVKNMRIFWPDSENFLPIFWFLAALYKKRSTFLTNFFLLLRFTIKKALFWAFFDFLLRFTIKKALFLAFFDFLLRFTIKKALFFGGQFFDFCCALQKKRPGFLAKNPVQKNKIGQKSGQKKKRPKIK